jgi:hypothetical protein
LQQNAALDGPKPDDIVPSFLVTHYFLPFHDPVEFAPSLGFYLDNPRSPEELKAVEDFFAETLLERRSSREPDDHLWSAQIDEFVKMGEIAETVFSDRPMHRLARMAVVMRFDDEGAVAELEQMREEAGKDPAPGFFLLEDDHPLVRNAKALDSFCGLVALLAHTEHREYNGTTITYPDLWLDHPDNASDIIVSSDVYMQLARAFDRELIEAHPNDAWRYFPFISKNLLSAARRLEAAYARGDSEILRFVGDLLVTARETRDPKLRIMLLVSVLELLVTRSPDVQRFNIEDSISRQFVLKLGVLAHLGDPSYNDFERLRSTLRTIYGRRSAIAHGGFSSGKGKNKVTLDDEIS